MKKTIWYLCTLGAALLAAPFAMADVPQAARQAAVVFLGEQHDNPTHHAIQADWIRALSPRALVFEMLTEVQAERVSPENRSNEADLERALDWANSGWPDFSMYFPLFAAAPDAEVIGAGLPRDRVIALVSEDGLSAFDPNVHSRFGLDKDLPDAQQARRESLQREAHCNALPEELLPKMVRIQRWRDAALADAALDALDRFGAPVVVITGNGHARDDWGAPFLLRRAAMDVSVFTLGQGEDGRHPDGGFSNVMDAPAVDRGDPCDAFN